jgi:hypothetical protein
MKKLLACVLALCVSVVVIGCSSETKPAPKKEPPKIEKKEGGAETKAPETKTEEKK